jgi:NodT family efflux transporter outer membrane factor (OMF) lipoprotein
MRALLGLGMLLLSACAVKRQEYHVPQVDLPKKFLKAQILTGTGGAPLDIKSPPLPATNLTDILGEWWLLLGSPELNALMDRALANNPDIRIATLRLAQLQARMDITRAGALPEINAPMQFRSEAPTGGIGSTAAGSSPASQRTFQASLRADWRPDLWGEFAAQLDASKLLLWRATFQRDDVQRTVAANVISAYFEFLSLNDRLRIARDTDVAVSEMLSAVAARLEVGDATIIEYEQQKAAVYQVRATVPVLQQQRELVFNRLSSLVGTIPSSFQLSDKGLNSIRFPEVLPGVPSALLLRRPDIRAVEAQLLAADADIDTARARVLPALDLTSSVGFGSRALSELLSPQNLAWNFIANLSANLFDGGKRSKEIEFARAVHEELVETYVRVIHDAVRGVDDSLTSIKMMENRLRLQRISVDAAYRAWTYSQEAYRAGAVDYLVVLDSERTYTRNLDDWVGARLQRLQGLTSLFSALGGGVGPGIASPGDGQRPLALKLDTDYGALTQTQQVSPEPAQQVVSTDPIESNATETVIDASPAGLSETGQIALAMSPSLTLREPVTGIDWTETRWLEPGTHWLVEISGLYERASVAPAWRDLRERFPEQFKNRVMTPHRQGLVSYALNERASWYRLYIADLEQVDAAHQLCADLRSAQQRCRVMVFRQTDERGDRVKNATFEEVDPLLGTAETSRRVMTP